MKFLPQRMTKRPVRLPLDYQEKTLADLPEGVTVITLPWAMAVDSDGSCWLRVDYPYEHRRMGTMCMAVTRHPDGWHVRTDSGYGYKWTPENIGGGIPYEPVVSLDGIEGGA